MRDFKCGPNGNCAWCGELNYGGHEDCKENYELASHDVVWTFANPAYDLQWRSWDCLATSLDQLFEKCKKIYGRTAEQTKVMGLVPIELNWNDVPVKYHPQGRAAERAKNMRNMISSIEKKVRSDIEAVENPNTWNEVQKAIHRAIQDHEQSVKDGFIGYSLTTTIYNALVRDGHVILPKGDSPENM